MPETRRDKKKRKAQDEPPPAIHMPQGTMDEAEMGKLFNEEIARCAKAMFAGDLPEEIVEKMTARLPKVEDENIISEKEFVESVIKNVVSEELVQSMSLLRQENERQDKAIKRLTRKNKELEAKQAALQETFILSHGGPESLGGDDELSTRMESTLREGMQEVMSTLIKYTSELVNQSCLIIVEHCRDLIEKSLLAQKDLIDSHAQGQREWMGKEMATNETSMQETRQWVADSMEEQADGIAAILDEDRARNAAIREKHLELFNPEDEIAELKGRLLSLEMNLEELVLGDEKKAAAKGNPDNGGGQTAGGKKGGKKKR